MKEEKKKEETEMYFNGTDNGLKCTQRIFIFKEKSNEKRSIKRQKVKTKIEKKRKFSKINLHNFLLNINFSLFLSLFS